MVFRISLDVMGGDKGAEVVLPAVIRSLKSNKDIFYFLVGVESLIREGLGDALFAFSDRYEIVNATQQVGMDENPVSAMKNKKQSSMRLALNLVKSGRADACLSAGNTGALVATARYVLKMIPGVSRPAIMHLLPTTGDRDVRMLDLGANIDVTAEHLFQFALMGSSMVSAVIGVARPRIGLLNIGEEAIKGNVLIKDAARLIENHDALNYIGYVEGDVIFKGSVDLVVCDGFVGNVALKVTEGVAKMIKYKLKQALSSSWWVRLLVFPAAIILKKMVKEVDPNRYNGAVILGLNGIVIKSHGSTTVNGFLAAINEACQAIEADLVGKVTLQMSSILKEA